MILVTGATGVIGSAVVAELVARQVSFRVLVRDAAKVAQLPNTVERAVGSWTQPATIAAAMSGITRVFLLSKEIEPAQFAATVQTARAQGVRQIVKLSTLEAAYGSDGIARWHRAEERVIEGSGLAWTFVRPGNFASNALQWAHAIRAEGRVYAATGEGRSSPIDPQDIAAVIALALCEEGHAGQAYPLTGPELLSVRDQVAVLARVLQRPLSFVDLPPEQLGEQLRAYHMQPAMVTALVELWHSIRKQDDAVVTDTVPRLLGRPAHTFEHWVRQHQAAFISP